MRNSRPSPRSRASCSQVFPNPTLCPVRLRLKFKGYSSLTHARGLRGSEKLVCNTNGRQAVFFLEPGHSRYQAMIIDQGFCFNAGEWNFPDAPLRGIYPRHWVYEQITGIESFDPWLSRVERRMTRAVLGEIADGIPPEWYNDEYEKLGEVLLRLDQRRGWIRERLVAARNYVRQPFPSWK